jgi:hypothetical protein
MSRFTLFVLSFSTTLALSVGPGHAASSLSAALAEHFRPSRMDVQHPAGEGRIVQKGTVLVLQADAVPADKLRVVQINTKSPRFHTPDYARVQVGTDGRLTARPGVMTLPKGTRLVILDTKVDRDQVRVFTHTLEPVRLPDGTAAYGCTEFVFAFEPSALTAGDATAVASRIEQWLTPTSAS